MERAGDAALRPGDGEVRKLPLLDTHRQRAPDPRPQGRGVDAGIGGEQGRRLPLQVNQPPRRDFPAAATPRLLPLLVLYCSVLARYCSVLARYWSVRANVRPRR